MSRVLREDFITQGPRIERFEKKFAKYVGSNTIRIFIEKRAPNGTITYPINKSEFCIPKFLPGFIVFFFFIL